MLLIYPHIPFVFFNGFLALRNRLVQQEINFRFWFATTRFEKVYLKLIVLQVFLLYYMCPGFLICFDLNL